MKFVATKTAEQLDLQVRLIEETLRAGETVCGVARRNGMAQSLLFTWRLQAGQGRLGSEGVPALVPVEVASTPAPAPAFGPQPSSPPAQRPRGGMIEIELGGGCRVRVDREVDTEALQRVLELLRLREKSRVLRLADAAVAAGHKNPRQAVAGSSACSSAGTPSITVVFLI
ncbi:transposase-like protein [Bradyrhizobium sp. i1.8.4]|uniref:IS66-like element accessory protein TnpA n=1 Tax=unclassified Bradyrhizobium TaxID=2631580 RepID=UPI003D2430A1